MEGKGIYLLGGTGSCRECCSLRTSEATGRCEPKGMISANVPIIPQGGRNRRLASCHPLDLFAASQAQDTAGTTYRGGTKETRALGGSGNRMKKEGAGGQGEDEGSNHLHRCKFNRKAKRAFYLTKNTLNDVINLSDQCLPQAETGACAHLRGQLNRDPLLCPARSVFFFFFRPPQLAYVDLPGRRVVIHLVWHTHTPCSCTTTYS